MGRWAGELVRKWAGELVGRWAGEKVKNSNYIEIGMTANRTDFALIGHPFGIEQLYRYLSRHRPGLDRLKRGPLLKLFEWTSPYTEREVEMTSIDGQTVCGEIIICPLLPEMVKDNDRGSFRALCIEKVISALRLAKRHGAKIAGLGGFTSIADGDQGRLVAKEVPIAVTSGNTLTAMAAIESVISATKRMGLDLSEATVAVIGASGDIGTACSRYLATRVRRLVLTSRFSFNLSRIAEELRQYKKAEISVERGDLEAINQADVVITAASSVTPIFHQRDFNPGTVVCDVGYPKNIFLDCEIENSDIFLFSGGLLTLPVPMDIPFDIMGLPDPKVMYGCWCEALVLAMEGRYESFSLGRGLISPKKMELIWDMAKRHGFRQSPFFFGDKMWTEKDIERVNHHP